MTFVLAVGANAQFSTAPVFGPFGSAIITLSMTGLDTNPPNDAATPGDHASLSVTAPDGVFFVFQSWGLDTYGAPDYGSGSSPTDYTSGDGGNLVWEAEGDDGNTYRAIAPIRYAVGAAPTISTQNLTVDDDVVSIDASASGTGLTFTYVLTTGLGNAQINSSTGEITVSGNGGAFSHGDVGTGNMQALATDQYGREVGPYNVPYNVSLRAQAIGGADLDLSFVEDSAITATDLTANWTLNGNSLTWAITGTALPTGLSVDSAGVMTGTPVTAAADATYTLRGTDEYDRPTDDTFTLEVTAAEAFSFEGQTDGIHVSYTGSLTITGQTDGISLSVTEGDATAPTLSNPVDAANGDTAATGSVDTDEGNGTLYWIVSTGATAPNAAQVKAGNDHTGSAAADNGSQSVGGTGTQALSPAPSGLTASTTYYIHFMHEDAATNQSAVASGDGFTTAAASGDELTISDFDEGADTLDLTSSEPGTCYYGIYPSGTVSGDITIADMIAGTDTGLVDNGTAGIFVAAGTLDDEEIDDSMLSASTEYVIAFVVDIDDGGSYTNLALQTFTTSA